jgi:hypothetical protein
MALEPPIRTGILELDVAEWVEYFNSLAVGDGRWLATVELSPQPLNGQQSDSGRRLHAISYDTSVDELEIRVGGGPRRSSPVRYFVSSPHTITLEEFPHGRAILVDDARGVRTLIRLFDASRDDSSPTLSLAEAQLEPSQGDLSGPAIEAVG